MSISRLACLARIAPTAIPGHERNLIATHGSPGVPHTVWLAPKNAIKSPIAAGTSLPVWALNRACAQFAPTGGQAAVLFGPGPARTDQAPEPGALAPGWLQSAEHTDLFDAQAASALTLAVVLADPAPYEADPHDALAAGFYRQIATALRPGGVLLVHTHPHHAASGLLDPAAATIRAARAAGLLYAQHLVLVHHRLDARTGARFAQPRQLPVAPIHRRAHTDLYAFTPRPVGEPR